MFNGIHTGMGAGDWVLMVLLWVALLALIAWAVARLFPTRTDTRSDVGETPETPSDILNRRLARGEIDAPTYEALRAKLSSRPFAGRR